MNEDLVILDALDINLVDSNCRKEFKLNNGAVSGMGEKRLFIRNTRNPSLLDDFFDFDKIQYFYYKKEDLLNYLEEAKEEFLHPQQDYQNEISKYYKQLCEEINNLPELVKMNFKTTYDKQFRYYLVLDGSISKNNKNRIAYVHFNNICLPRLTKIRFEKIKIKSDGSLYIYMIPMYTGFNLLDK